MPLSFEISESIRMTGTMINYYVVCPRRLWLFSRKLGWEADSELVRLGLLLHEQSFPRERKEVLIMNRIKIENIGSGQRKINLLISAPAICRTHQLSHNKLPRNIS